MKWRKRQRERAPKGNQKERHCSLVCIFLLFLNIKINVHQLYNITKSVDNVNIREPFEILGTEKQK